jgi:GntR family transcriptional regulator, transcriptional repressor for pyruvate dehydrogenase complex
VPERDSSFPTLSQQIVDRIRSDFFAGTIASGDRLGSEADIAGAFGVSRMAARDALRALAALGIVENRVGVRGGVFVAFGDIDVLVDAFTVQARLAQFTPAELLENLLAIEVLSAELAAARGSAESHEYIQRAYEYLSTEALDQHTFASVAFRFHEAVVLSTRNRALVLQFRAIRRLIQPEYERDLTEVVRERIVSSCGRLTKLIVARDGIGARNQMEERLSAVRAKEFVWNCSPEIT